MVAMPNSLSNNNYLSNCRSLENWTRDHFFVEFWSMDQVSMEFVTKVSDVTSTKSNKSEQKNNVNTIF